MALLSLLAWNLTKPASSQSDPLSIAETIRAREFALGSRILFSPDGKWLTYTINRCHAEDADVTLRAQIPSFMRGADIYVANTTSRQEKIVTQGGFDNWWPAWSPNSQYLAFLSNRDGSNRLKVWIWDSHTNVLRKISNVPVAFGPLQWTPDGQQIVVSRPIDSPEAVGDSTEVDVAASRARSTVRVYEGTKQPEAAPWNLSGYLTSLELMGVNDGRMKTIVRGQIGTYKLSPDGSHLAFTVAKTFEKPAAQQILFDFVVLNVNSGQSWTGVSDARLDTDGPGFSWSPNSAELCLRAEGGHQEAPSYWIVSVDRKPTHRLIEPSPRADSRIRETPVWDEGSRAIYFIENGGLWRGDIASGHMEEVAHVPGRRVTQIVPNADGALWLAHNLWAMLLTHDDGRKQDGLYAINTISGESQKLIEQGQCYSCILDGPVIAASKEAQKVAFVAEDATHPGDLWISDFEFRNPEQLTHINPAFDPMLMGKARLIDWLSDDGQPLKGVLLLPSHYEPEKRYPLVTYVYGGALLSNRLDRFGLANTGPLNMQLLATRGYAVFLPDTPLTQGTPMLSLTKTVLPGVNKVIEMGIADPERLAVMGHSYGGYSVLSLIVQTNRFKAAVAMSGDGDLLGLYGEMENDGTAYGVALTEYGQSQIGGTPWDHRDGFIENSPFFYYDRVETPVLVIQGRDDTAVAPFLADQTFVALRRLGKEVEYAKYSGEGHSPAQEWTYSNQVDFCTRMIGWLDHHLKQDSASGSPISQQNQGGQD